jgi:hypothetical protein
MEHPAVAHPVRARRARPPAPEHCVTAPLQTGEVSVTMTLGHTPSSGVAINAVGVGQGHFRLSSHVSHGGTGPYIATSIDPHRDIIHRGCRQPNAFPSPASAAPQLAFLSPARLARMHVEAGGSTRPRPKVASPARPRACVALLGP